MFMAVVVFIKDPSMVDFSSPATARPAAWSIGVDLSWWKLSNLFWFWWNPRNRVSDAIATPTPPHRLKPRQVEHVPYGLEFFTMFFPRGAAFPPK
jgi:hypothetical protein